MSDPVAAGTVDLGVVARWSKVEIELVGPESIGLSTSANPFRIDLEITFVGPGPRSYRVPGFYAGDGSGGMDGAVWRVRFTPDAVGSWTFSSSSSEPLLDGVEGSFEVSSPVGCPAHQPGTVADLNCVGRLQWVGGHYLKFSDGPYWLKGGVDDPEDFLAPASNAGFPNKQEAIDFLAAQGVNSFFFLVNNVDGDRQNVVPWVSNYDSEHFNIAELDRWDGILDAIQGAGLVLHLTFEDDSGWTGFDRVLFYRQMVARFGHYNGLIWNLSEEYNENYTATDIKAFAQTLSDLDPYDHPLTVHHQGATARWDPFFGDPLFDLTSLHSKAAVPVNETTVTLLRKSAQEGRPIPIAFDETGDITADRATFRHILWSIYLGGGMLELHLRPLSDYRDWTGHFADMSRARSLLEAVPFWQMQPANELLITGMSYLFALPGHTYFAYLPDGGSASFDLTADDSLFEAQWIDPASGTIVPEGTLTGGGPLGFTAPDSADWLLHLDAITGDDNVAPLAADQAYETAEDASVPIALSFSDPDGPGPYDFTIVDQPLFGTLTAPGPDGRASYSPNAGFVGFDSFRWSVSDQIESSNTATVTVRVGNRPPEALDQWVALVEDQAAPIGLAGSDPDGDALDFIVVTNPTRGVLGGQPPSLVYSPLPNVFGVDVFEFRVDDGRGGSDLGSVTLQIQAVNDPPTAHAASVTAVVDTPRNLVLTGGDVDGDPLQYAIVSGPTHGVLGDDDGDPLLVYTPANGFLGSDGFTFVVDDGHGPSAPAQVSIEVLGPLIHHDGFESGDVEAWSLMSPSPTP